MKTPFLLLLLVAVALATCPSQDLLKSGKGGCKVQVPVVVPEPGPPPCTPDIQNVAVLMGDTSLVIPTSLISFSYIVYGAGSGGTSGWGSVGGGRGGLSGFDIPGSWNASLVAGQTVLCTPGIGGLGGVVSGSSDVQGQPGGNTVLQVVNGTLSATGPGGFPNPGLQGGADGGMGQNSPIGIGGIGGILSASFFTQTANPGGPGGPAAGGGGGAASTTAAGIAANGGHGGDGRCQIIYVYDANFCPV